MWTTPEPTEIADPRRTVPHGTPLRVVRCVLGFAEALAPPDAPSWATRAVQAMVAIRLHGLPKVVPREVLAMVEAAWEYIAGEWRYLGWPEPERWRG